MQYLKQSTAVDVVLGPFVDDTDGKTTEEALTLSQADLQLTKNGGTAAQKNDSTSATHLYGGNYKVPLNTTDTNTLGCLTLMCKESGALPVVAHFMVVTANWYDSMCSTDKLDVNVVEAGGGTVPSGAIPNAVAGAAGGLFIAGTNAATSITTSGGSALTLSSTGANGSGLTVSGNGSGHGIAATGGATGNGMKLLGGGTSGAGLDVRSQGGTGGANYAIYAAGNATGADTGGLYATGGATGGEGIEAVGTGNGHGLYCVGAGSGEGIQAQGGASGNGMDCVGGGASNSGLVLRRGGIGGDDLNFFNNDCTIPTVTALANGSITAAVIATGAIDADAFAANAISANVFATDAIDSRVIATGAIASDAFAAGAINAAAIATGAIDADALASGTITAAKFASGAIDAAALAADAVDEILDEQIGDGTLTMRQVLRVLVSAAAGKLTGAATTTITIRNVADSQDVIVATVDANGNRTPAPTVTP